MNKIAFLTALVLLAGCKTTTTDDTAAKSQEPSVAVTTTQPIPGSIKQEYVVSAHTAYLQKSTITAPIPAFITEAHAQPGQRVSAGQVLYKLQSKEQHALGEDFAGQAISITSPTSGIILDVFGQSGEYVTEGATLCTIANAGSLVFVIDMPAEKQRQSVKDLLYIELPDGTRLPATIRQTMATMNVLTQAKQVVAYARTSFLPEELRVNAIFTSTTPDNEHCYLLPKDAVQSDETQSSFWVMRINGNKVKRVPVEVIARNAEQTEVKSTELSSHDKIVLAGSYGLTEGANIKITDNEDK